MMEVTKGLKTLLATLETQKSRGWAAHNEFDYFTLCPTCGHWFDCRDPDNLVKHKHASTDNIVVTTMMPAPSGQIIGPAVQSQTSPPAIAAEAPNLLPETPAGGTKS